MSNNFQNQIEAFSNNAAVIDKYKSIREHIHQYPELSFLEEDTSNYVQLKLKELNIDFQVIGKTGIQAWIKGKNSSLKTIIVRAELDALPILEETESSFKSQNDGIMHACGHDFHTSILLGCADIWNQLKDDFHGTIKLVFQPGEEKLPGGASILIKEGVLNEPNLDAIIGIHVLPELEAGKIGFKKGQYMASTDEIFIKVVGKGGHGAMPHHTIDPIIISAQFILQAQQIVSRFANPIVPTVLTFGKIESQGGATNVIPSIVEIQGTFRTYNEGWRQKVHHHLEVLAKSLSDFYECQIELNIVIGYPFLNNDEKLTQVLIDNSKNYFQADDIVSLDMRPTADDFAFYSQHKKSCFYRIGVGNKAKGIVYGVHHPKFAIDDAAYSGAIKSLASNVICLLDK